MSNTTPQPRDTNWFERFFEREKANAIEIGKNALVKFAGVKVGNANVGEKVLEETGKFAEIVSKPYREYVSPNLTAALLVANDSYREQNKNLSIQQLFDKAKQDSVRSIPQVYGSTPGAEWRKSISPGRAAIGLLGETAENLTGREFGASKLNWADTVEVEKYFTQGAPQFWSGLVDAGASTFLDPVYRAAVAAKQVKTAAITRPVSKPKGIIPTLLSRENAGKISAEIDEAVAGKKNAAGEVIDFVERSKDIQGLMNYGFVSNSADPMSAANALLSANVYGGRQAIADVMKVMVGDEQTFQKLIKRNDELAVTSATLAKRSLAIEEKIAQQEKGLSYGSRLNLSAKKIQQIEESNKAIIENVKKLKEEKSKIGEKVKVLNKERKNLETRIGVSETNPEKALTTTGTETLFGVASTTWSPFSSVERIRTVAAELNAKGYWGEVDPKSNFAMAKQVAEHLNVPVRFVRASYWLSPNTQLKEVPAGVAMLDGVPAQFSYKEVNSRLRYLVKHAGMSSQAARARAQKYSSLTTADERFRFLENLQRDYIVGVIRKQFPKQTAKLSKQNDDALIEFANHLMRETSRRRAALIDEIIKKNYTNIDTKSGSVLAQMHIKKLVNDLAVQRARGRGVQRAEAQDIRAVEDMLRNQPSFATQLPNIHFSLNMDDMRNVVQENRLAFKGFIEQVIEEDISPKLLKKMIADDQRFRMANQGSAATAWDIASSRAKTGKDRVTDLLDIYQTFVWKPTTLLSMKYTTRNVFEGWLRVASSMMDMSSQYGYAWTDMVRGFANEAVYSPYRTIKNTSIRLGTRVTDRKLRKVNTNLIIHDRRLGVEVGVPLRGSRDFAKKAIDSKASALDDALLEANDSITFPLTVLTGKIEKISGHIGNASDKVAVKKIIFMRDSLVSNTSLNKQQNAFLNGLLQGDYNRAYKTALSMDAQQASEALDHLGSRVEELLVDLSTLDRNKMSPGLLSEVKDIEFFASRLDRHLDVAKVTFSERDVVQGRFVAVQEKASAKERLSKTFEGKVEIAKGVYIGKSLAGEAGDLLRTATSARSSSVRLLNDENRTTGLHLLNTGSETRPIDIDDNLWVSAHAEYVNNVIMKDALGSRIVKGLAEGKSVSQVKKDALAWTKSGEASARQYIREQKTNLKEYNANNAGISDLIDENIIQIRVQYLPDVDEFGNSIMVNVGGKSMTLPQAAVEGKLTASVSSSIPMNVRNPVSGTIEVTGANAKVYRNIVNTIFHFVATLPEDHLIRHPFYNMVHDSEAMRLSKLVQRQAKEQGKDPAEMVAKYADKIKRTAVKRAYKELMQRMYSVERYTDLASFMRFVSPFYMAHQNSSRYWLGTTLRNPDVAVALAKAYNAPYRMGVVYDEEGNNVSSGNPWSSKRDQIIIGYGDKGIGKFLREKTGQDEFISDPTAIDVITQGQLPVWQTIGGPVAQTAFTMGMGYVNPDMITQRYFGKNAEDIVSRYVMPFYEKSYGKGLTETLSANFNPMNSWMVSTMAAITKRDSKYATEEANARFNARFNSAHDMIVLERSKLNLPLNEDEIRLQAARYATNSLWVEALSSFFGPILAGKGGNSEIRELDQELNRLRKEFGGDSEKAALELTRRLEMRIPGSEYMGAVPNILTTRATSNRLSLLATPQTLKNLEDNKALIEKIDYLFPDRTLLGEVLSAGNSTDDYSTFVEDKMYSMSLNGKPLRERLTNPEERAKRQQMSMGWEVYFTNIEYIEAHAKARGISKYSNFYKDKYQKWKDAVTAQVEQTYPIWAAREQTITLDEANVNISILSTLASDKKFMSTAGKSSSAMQGFVTYMQAREVIMERFRYEQARTGVMGADTNQNRWILEWRNQVVDEIVKQNPGFERLWTRYLSKDVLEDVPVFTELG